MSGGTQRISVLSSRSLASSRDELEIAIACPASCARAAQTAE
jgi:hypothetical protein